MRVERIDSADDARLDDYRIVRDPELVRTSASFLAEGRLVVRTLLRESALRVRSVLCDETALAWLAGELGDAVPVDVPVYVAAAGLRGVGGWSFHQGCLALGARPPELPATELLSRLDDPRLVVGLDGVTNPDNVGAIFRSAAAFGAAGVLLSPACASPLYRKALRTSMGAALTLPFSHGPDWGEGLASLEAAGFTLCALTPEGSEPLDEVARALPRGARRALILGAEDSGLSAATLERADRRVRIPMRGGVDSLNVAASAAVALYRLAT